MSTFRSLGTEDIDQVRRQAGVDAVTDVTPVAAGIENSNWFITLRRGEDRFPCVLTLVESLPEEELPFFIALTSCLAEADLPVPIPLPLADQRRQFLLQDRPALLVPRLPGTHVGRPPVELCRRVGCLLATMHRASRRCPLDRDRPDHRWWPSAFAWLAPSLPPEVHDELAGALVEASRLFGQCRPLPRGIIHGDLFRDNVLVDNGRITGVLDFFHATRDLLAWDIAITLNDWAVHDGRGDPERRQALLDGYESERPLSSEEAEMLPGLQRAAAARFWLSRLVSVEHRRSRGLGAGPSGKDPEAMRTLWRTL